MDLTSEDYIFQYKYLINVKYFRYKKKELINLCKYYDISLRNTKSKIEIAIILSLFVKYYKNRNKLQIIMETYLYRHYKNNKNKNLDLNSLTYIKLLYQCLFYIYIDFYIYKNENYELKKTDIIKYYIPNIILLEFIKNFKNGYVDLWCKIFSLKQLNITLLLDKELCKIFSHRIYLNINDNKYNIDKVIGILDRMLYNNNFIPIHKLKYYTEIIRKNYDIFELQIILNEKIKLTTLVNNYKTIINNMSNMYLYNEIYELIFIYI